MKDFETKFQEVGKVDEARIIAVRNDDAQKFEALRREDYKKFDDLRAAIKRESLWQRKEDDRKFAETLDLVRSVFRHNDNG